MPAITPWSLGLAELANGTAKHIPASRPAPRPAYKPAPITGVETQEEEVARKKKAVEDAKQAEIDAGAKTEWNTGTAGGRVLTQDEIKNGWVDSQGRYREGRKSFGDYGMSNKEFQDRHGLSNALSFYFDGLDQFTGPYAARELSFVPNAVVLGEDDGEWARAAMEYMNGIFGSDPRISALGGGNMPSIKLSGYEHSKRDDYNAFLGGRGGLQDGSYRDDSVAAYFKDAFGDRIVDRSDAHRDLMSWNEGSGNNLGSMAMTQDIFNQMKLADKYGLSWGQAGSLNNLAGTDEGQEPAINPGSDHGVAGEAPYITDVFPDGSPGDGMLSGGASSWLDVLNAGGNTNWNGMLGQYTKDKIDTNWAGMNTGQIQQEFGKLFDGGMFSQGADRSLIYDKLMENLGRV